MDTGQVSYDLLGHFERHANARGSEPAEIVCTRGVGWVLQWFAAMVTLFFAAGLLAQFCYCLAAELTLARAARAGALEATLPRATYRSVSQSVERRLAGYPQQLSSRLRFCLQQNGAPIRGIIQAREGDRLAVTLAVPTHDAMPRWLRTAFFWRADSLIEVRAERQKPGRQLPSS